MEIYKIKYPFGYRTIDLHSICYYVMTINGEKPPIKDGTSDLNLDRILNYVDLPSEPRPHNALIGAKWKLKYSQG